MARTTTKSASAKKTAPKKTVAAADKAKKVTAKATAKVAAVTAKTKAKAKAANVKPAVKTQEETQTVNPVRLLVELLGTFILTFVVITLLSGKFGLSLFVSQETISAAIKAGQPVDIPTFAITPIIVAATLSILTVMLYRISGAVLNPAISIGQLLLRKVKVAEGLGYILAQVLGGMLALSVATRIITVTNAQTGQVGPLSAVNIFSHQASWPIFTAEVMGAVVFGLGVAAAIASSKALVKGLLVGGGFLLGAVIAASAGAGILNPAVAVGTGLIGMGDNIWPLVGIYIGGTTLGMVIGMALFELFNRNAGQSAEIVPAEK